MEFITRILYQLLVKSGIVCLLMPFIRKLILYGVIGPSNKSYLNIDDSGCSMLMTKFNGKLYPPFGEQNFSKIKHLRIRDDDVLICGYPKTGCHWIFEIVRMLLKKTTSVSKYGKEFEGFLEALPEFVLDSLPSPRILNTHLPFADLPEEIKMRNTKIILTTRCPKDTVVSDYNHHKNMRNLFHYDGKFDDYFKLFMKGQVDYGCFFQYTCDWHSVMTSNNTTNPIFLLRFEELKSNPVDTIRKVAIFLDVDITEKTAENISKWTDFKRMKTANEDNKLTSALYRKGIVGDWRNWLTDAQSEEMDARSEATINQIGTTKRMF